jgi:DNA (cytosine-5)-methyltransferase 1
VLLDLFSGIGGFSLAARNVGWVTSAFCEIDPYCRQVLKKHWPDVPIYEDVRDVTAERLESDGITARIISGGFPCQDISYAGKGAGIEGERSGLWKEYARIIGELRPEYAIMENVAALLSRGMGVVLGDLAEIGYDAEWHCIPASALGAPHRRDRVWIIAYPDTQGVSRLVKADDISQVGSWGWRSKKNLCDVDWVGRSADWPKPLVRRVDDGLPDRVDRIKGLGNSICPAIPEIIFRAIDSQLDADRGVA